MTTREKNEIISKIETTAKNCFSVLRRILTDNDLRYCAKYSDFRAVAFPNGVPEITDEMLEDLCFDAVENPESVTGGLFEKSYIEKIVAEREERNSPKNRILEHMSEIKRLKEKYGVTDKDLEN